jgi:gliding motility-associated-like protein
MTYAFYIPWLKRSVAILFIVIGNVFGSFALPCAMQSPQITCVTLIPNGDVLLTWENPSVIDSSFDSYRIYKANSIAGPYVVVDSIFSSTQTSYMHVGAKSNLSSVFYYIEARCGYGNTVSAIDTLTSLGIPTWDTLSVNNNNEVELSWKLNNLNNIEGIIIYYYNGVSFPPIDTVYGKTATSYMDTLANPKNKKEDYRIAAFDKCGNISPLSNVYSSIYLTAKADICSRSAMLSWTEYPTAGANTHSYRIYQSTIGAGGPYTFVNTVAKGILNYTANNLQPSTMYYFKVEAVSITTGATASSNRLSFYSAQSVPPSFFYLRQATVVNNNAVQLVAHIDVTASISGYKILRSFDTISKNFSQIATLKPSLSSQITYTDINVDVSQISYYYKMVVVDSCGFDGAFTNISHPIVLTVVSNTKQEQNELSWTAYIGFQAGVREYAIYRSVDGVSNPIRIATIPTLGESSFTYIDNVSAETEGTGAYHYYIEANENGGNTFGFKDNSFSNSIKAYQLPTIYIPNSFIPEGEYNTSFIPVTTFINNEPYTFSVYDRWGAIVFSTHDKYKAWDGTSNNRLCEMGVYVYVVEYQSARGLDYIKKGTLVLMK